MKNILFISAAVLLSGGLQAQKLKETEVPQAVKNSFVKTFPNVKSINWSKESESEFEAEFKNGEMEQSANFDATGKWLVTKTEIKKTDLPPLVQAALKKEFEGYKVEEAEKVETPEGISYEVEVEKGEIKYSVQLTKDGKIIKEEKNEEEVEAKDGE